MQKIKKTPGPDQVPMDLFKGMDRNNMKELLEIITAVRNEAHYPAELCKANIISIFKKGCVEDPGNHRPIALLQSVYKLHAALFRNRLIAGLDHRIYASQYGSRGKKSTAQSLFIARRLIDVAEASGETLYMIFLHWEKAFDKVDQAEMINAVWRMNVPSETEDELERRYGNMSFCIKDGEGLSTERDQKNGIRQGCPLSPYLFIILMTAMFLDVHAEMGKKSAREQRRTLTPQTCYMLTTHYSLEADPSQ